MPIDFYLAEKIVLLPYMELLFENVAKTASIFFYPEADMGRLKLAGKIDTDDFKTAYDKLLEYAVEKKLHKGILDLTDLQYSPPLARAWLATNFAKRALKFLDKSPIIGIVKSQNAFQRLAASAVISSLGMLGSKIKIEFFETLAEAENWLKNQ
ncbi:SpoIIAA-like [Thermoflexibacter ruber]|uniref:SpoIIAA-like n=2 Tax=Thermoflexibacter ruber TaxID=1003 RepID=A0A1I2DUF2_9BACT|nr:SpoIIAA-like [Thermoflexibacter ruber]